MRLTAFKIVNCFGFQDSGWVNLKDDHNFIYILGRNSSGKSSLLNAIKYFEWNTVPSKQSGFINFNESLETPALGAKYQLESSDLSELRFETSLAEKLAKLKIDESSMQSNSKLKTLFDTVLSIYTELLSRIKITGEINVWKLSNGHYHFLEDGNDEYNSRKERVGTAIDAAKNPGQNNFNIKGTPTQLSISWSDFEDLLFLRISVIVSSDSGTIVSRRFG